MRRSLSHKNCVFSEFDNLRFMDTISVRGIPLMIYVFYSVPYDLPDTFAGPDYYAALQKDPETYRIFENTAARTITVYMKKEPVRLTDRGTGHYGLIAALSETLPETSTIVFPDVTNLADESNAAVSLAHRFLDRHINLEFQNSPWLNTKNMDILFMTNPYEARASFNSLLTKTIEWKTSPAVLPQPADIDMLQASSSIKKNRI